MGNDFPILIIKPEQTPEIEEYRAKQARQRQESYDRYRELLIKCFNAEFPNQVEAARLADVVLETLYVHHRVNSEDECLCGCHPSLPSTDLHDFGFNCSCTWDQQEREERHREWRASMQKWWDSPTYKEFERKQEEAELELDNWLSQHPQVVVTRHGGWAPEQWEGEVDGHSFYFRERHDLWRIELDLEPTGNYYNTWEGTDDDGEPIYGKKAITSGDVIAEGSTGAEKYGNSPTERIQFIVAEIRSHLKPNLCSACGAKLGG